MAGISTPALGTTSGSGGGTGNSTIIAPLGSKPSASSVSVVVASDQSSIPVAATLSAETTKAIGVVRNADGSGNLLTSTANALDVNMKSGSTGTPSADVSSSGTLGSLNATADLTIAGYNSISFVVSGTWVGTITFYASSDGTTFVASHAFSVDNMGAQPSTTTNQTFIPFFNAGMQKFRCKMTAYTSGTATITWNKSQTVNYEQVYEAMSGMPIPAMGAMTMGSDGTNAQNISTDTAGRQIVKLSDGTNIANTLSGTGTAAGQVSQMVAGAYMASVSFTTTIVANLATTDVGNYRLAAVQFTSAGTNSQTAFQVSNDNVNWVNTEAATTTINTGVWNQTIGAGTGIVYVPLCARYFRLAVSGISAGTTAGLIHFSTLPMGAWASVGVTAVQSGTWTMVGGKNNNTAVPGGTNLGVLPAVANAAIQTWTEGNEVLASSDLAGNIRVLQVAGTGTLANVASSATNVTIFSANNSAKSRIIFNESTQVLYIKFGTTASATSYTTQIASNTLFEFPQPTYTGQVDGLWASANGNARTTEVT